MATQLGPILASDIGTTANDITSGSLFARLNKVRSVHLAGVTQKGNTTAKNALTAHFTTNQVSKNTAATTQHITNLKSYLTYMKTYSPYVSTDFGSGIAVPARGSKINFATYTLMNTAVTNLERVSATNTAFHSGNYGYNSSNYSSNYGYDSGDYSGNYGYDSGDYSGNNGYDSSNYSGNNGYDSSNYSGNNSYDFCRGYSSSDSGACSSRGFAA